MKEKYLLKIDNYKNNLAKMRRKSMLYGVVKAALLITFAVAIYLMLDNWSSVMFKLITAFLLAVQFLIWRFHYGLSRHIDHALGMIDIYQKRIDRIDGKWTEFSDTGIEFSDRKHPYSNDLDIVGKKSIFQMINTTHSWHGRRIFASDLLAAKYSKIEVEERQEAVSELAGKNEFTAELEYILSKICSDGSEPKFIEKLKDGSFFMKNKIMRIILTFLPLLTITAVMLTLFLDFKVLSLAATVLSAMQIFIWVVAIPAVNRYTKGIKGAAFKLSGYSDAIKFVAAENFESLELKKIKNNLAGAKNSAVFGMADLEKIVKRLSAGGNAILYFILNALLLWDIRCAFRLENWRAKYSAHCEQWFLSLGRLESLSSLAAVTYACGQICYPELSERSCFEAKKLGHPLIKNNERVVNEFCLNNNILIVSGSNMSGKTTFLRTVGINVVLMRAGAPVCAKEMRCSDFNVITSMRVADDLSEGVSTFYAELKRIKQIIDLAQKDKTTLFLIDEIFKGTNSVDRLEGARAVISKLEQSGVVGLITTHDLELCALENQLRRIINYSFSEQYENGKILFDYKLKSGKATTTNGKFLMEQIGIL